MGLLSIRRARCQLLAAGLSIACDPAPVEDDSDERGDQGDSGTDDCTDDGSATDSGSDDGEDPGGRVVWERYIDLSTSGSPTSGVGESIAVDAEGYTYIGASAHEGGAIGTWIGMLDPDGNLIWEDLFREEGRYAPPIGVAARPEGGVHLVYRSEPEQDGERARQALEDPPTVVLASYDRQGEQLGYQRHPIPLPGVWELKVTRPSLFSDGRLLAVITAATEGTHWREYDIRGEVVNDIELDADAPAVEAIAIDAEDNVYLAGFALASGGSTEVAFGATLQKRSSAGAIEWTDTSIHADAYDWIAVGKGHVYVAGALRDESSHRIWSVRAYDLDGELLWTAPPITVAPDVLHAVTGLGAAFNGDAFLTAFHYTDADYSIPCIVARLHRDDGRLVAEQSYKGVGCIASGREHDFRGGLAVHSDGAVFTVGSAYRRADSDQDVWVQKIRP